ncbi:MAG: uracil-DNA glycosylase family protein [Bacteroidales bacterium]|nr:uracil-DNA glycosylase family protein [Bacteroidales bacterium]
MIEYHPLKPFLPANAMVLFLGSFPPPKKRWCMDFFYPNFINDHWRIEGAIWFNDKNHFVNLEHKCFKMNEIIAFLNDKGIALYDTASAVNRLKDNASDAFLEIVERTDINALLKQIPQCRAIATTGEKATIEVCNYFNISEIPLPNNHILLKENLKLYRLPSSSRAYPLPFDKKVEAYRKMFEEIF